MCGRDCEHETLDPVVEPGYAYVATAVFGTRLGGIDNEDWEIVMYTPTGKEKYVCSWMIDGVWCYVWWNETKELFISQVISHKW